MITKVTGSSMKEETRIAKGLAKMKATFPQQGGGQDIDSTCNTGATVCGKRMDIRKWYGATDGRCKQNGLKCLND
jgi:hypothetical protein